MPLEIIHLVETKPNTYYTQIDYKNWKRGYTSFQWKYLPILRRETS